MGATRTGAVSAFLRRHMNQTEAGCCVRRRVKGPKMKMNHWMVVAVAFLRYFFSCKKKPLTFAPFVCEAFQFFFGGALGIFQDAYFWYPFFVASRIVTFGGR